MSLRGLTGIILVLLLGAVLGRSVIAIAQSNISAPSMVQAPTPPLPGTDLISIEEAKIQASDMQDHLNHDKDIVSEWKREARAETYIAIVVGLLGLIIGACQKTEKPWSRATTLILGLIVSILTLITSISYDSDYKALRRGIKNAYSPLASAAADLRTYSIPGQTPEGRRTIKEHFYSNLATFDNVSMVLQANESASAGGNAELVESESVVYAQTQPGPPDWTLTNGTSDSSSTYFVGMNEDTNAEIAKNVSLSNAYINGARSLISAHHSTNVDSSTFSQLTSLVRQLSIITNTLVTFDEGTRQYKFYTRIRVPDGINKIPIPDQRVASSTISLTLPNDSAIQVPGTDMMLLVKHMGFAPVSAEIFLLVGQPTSIAPFVADRKADDQAIAKLSPLGLHCGARLPVFYSSTPQPASCVKLNRYLVRKATGRTNYLGTVPSGIYKLIATGFTDQSIDIELRP